MATFPEQPAGKVPVDPTVKPFWLVQTGTRHLYPYNQYLATRTDMSPVYEKDAKAKMVGGMLVLDEAPSDKGDFDVIGDPEAVEAVESVEQNEPEHTANEIVDAIIEAIPTLKQFDYTSSGLPKVDKLSALLGQPIDSSARNEAWGKYLEIKDVVEEE